QWAVSKYSDFLIFEFSSENFFPLKMNRFGKISVSDLKKNFQKLSRELLLLKSQSKETLGYGYEIEYEEVSGISFGKNNIPVSVYFNDKMDYLKFIGKADEYQILLQDRDLLLKEFPELKAFIDNNSRLLISNSGKIEQIISVCRYFKLNPKPNLYLRQLQTENTDTKFIEENSSLLISFLDRVLPSSSVNAESKDFSERDFLKTSPRLIRFRFLDENPSIAFPAEIRDITLTLSDFSDLEFKERYFIITENLANFLSFPQLKNTVIIFGKGYSAVNMKKVSFLKNKEIYYWGDIDLHGLEILSKYREIFPQTESFLMDRETFETFSEYAVFEKYERKISTDHLTEEERELADNLRNRQESNRLEQEKIPYSYLEEKINHFFHDKTSRTDNTR
ncbi:MAG TPA: DUF2220 family protein, partial [Leptospiraceae bacterium]|nr:DUF2220 family protein [Leptospiraceae bacterium]